MYRFETFVVPGTGWFVRQRGGGPCVAGPIEDRERATRLAHAHGWEQVGALEVAARLFVDCGDVDAAERCLIAAWA